MDISLRPLLFARGAIDRSTALREDETWLAQAWADATSRVLFVHEGRTLIQQRPDGTALVLGSPRDVPAECPPDARYLLGTDDSGVPYFAVRSPLTELSAYAEGEPAGLRKAALLLNDRDAGLLVHAVALEQWHTTHQYCPRCGSRTQVVSAGHVRTCPNDDSQHFPRIDPAVIMLVEDDAGRVLLARGPQWPPGWMSVLAGFVEPGESLEHAVIREVMEEVGITVVAPRYLGSQPWPFPRSLMLGFTARATTTELRMRSAEISEARWMSRDELTALVASGKLSPPGRVSIARQLLESWYGGPINDRGTRL